MISPTVRRWYMANLLSFSHSIAPANQLEPKQPPPPPLAERELRNLNLRSADSHSNCSNPPGTHLGRPIQMPACSSRFLIAGSTSPPQRQTPCRQCSIAQVACLFWSSNVTADQKTKHSCFIKHLYLSCKPMY